MQTSANNSFQNAAVQRICVLGATGSIGLSTLDVVRRHPSRYQIIALTCYSQIDLVVEQAREFNPEFIVCGNPDHYSALVQKVNDAALNVEVLSGQAGLIAVAQHSNVDTVMAAIVGAAGLAATYAAAQAGKKVLLANKEALVMTGSLFMQAAAENQAQILPVDSEHNAIFQCLPELKQSSLAEFHLPNSITGSGTGNTSPYLHRGVEKLLLTGSGGPFLNTPVDLLHTVTPAQACKHPNWDMGRKISVDSATMMNKGLEFIEAHWLFGMPSERIEIVVHPQSVIHSMVQYSDGSVLAQMGEPDMRIPVAHTLAYPERIESGVSALDFTQLANLSFYPPDFARFPNLRLAINAVEQGQWASTALNAGNEMAVEAFLQEKIKFTDIAYVNEGVLEKTEATNFCSIEEVIEYDGLCRQLASQLIEEKQ